RQSPSRTRQSPSRRTRQCSSRTRQCPSPRRRYRLSTRRCPSSSRRCRSPLLRYPLFRSSSRWSKCSTRHLPRWKRPRLQSSHPDRKLQSNSTTRRDTTYSTRNGDGLELCAALPAKVARALAPTYSTQELLAPAFFATSIGRGHAELQRCEAERASPA